MLTPLHADRLRLIFAAAAMFLLSLETGCTSSSLTNVWRDPQYTDPPLTNMLIIAAKRNPVNRRLWEDEIVSALTGAGINATASYRFYEDSIPSPDEVGGAVRQYKFDGVLFIRRLPPQFTATYVEGAKRDEQVMRFNRHTQTYTTYYREVQDSGYFDTTRIERQEISVLLAKDQGGRLIWSGTGELINPASRDEVRREITGLIAPDLIYQRIIPKK